MLVEIGLQLKVTKWCWMMNNTMNQIVWLVFCWLTVSTINLVVVMFRSFFFFNSFFITCNCTGWVFFLTKLHTENAQITFMHFLLPWGFSLRFNVICSAGLLSDVRLISSSVELSYPRDWKGYNIQFKNFIYHFVYLHEMHNMNSYRNSQQSNCRLE